MKKYSMVLMSCLLLCATVVTAQDMISDQVEKFEDDPAAAFSAAMGAKDKMAAKAAFAEYLKKTSKQSEGSDIAKLAKFAAKKDMFFDAAYLIACYGDSMKLAGEMVGAGHKDLAAGVLALDVIAGYLSDEKDTRLAEVTVPDEEVPGRNADGRAEKARANAAAAAEKAKAKAEADAAEGKELQGKIKGGRGGKGKGGKGKKKKKGAAVATPLVVPQILFEDRESDTVELAILAAAYGKDGSAKAAIDAARVRGRIAAAKLLYYVLNGHEVTDQMVKDAFKAVPGAASGYILKVGPDLVSYNVLVPAEAMACEALGILGDERYLPLIHKAGSHKDIRVQVEAVKAMTKIGSKLSLQPLSIIIQKSSWPVLVEACDAVARVPHKNMIPALIARLEKEKGRLRLDVTRALSCIAGEQGKRRTAKDWKDWWAKEGRAFTVDEAKSEAFRKSHRIQQIDVPALGFFYGLSIYSDRFSYVVDTSASMKGDRMDSLRENMGDSLHSLKTWCMFNITDFGGTVIAMDKDALLSNKKKAKERAEKMPMSLGTRSYDAMEGASYLMGLDTMYFLSDGAPIRGQINKWKDIIRGLGVMHRYYPVTISTVTFDPKPGHQAGMKRMSFESYGEQEDVEF